MVVMSTIPPLITILVNRFSRSFTDLVISLFRQIIKMFGPKIYSITIRRISTYSEKCSMWATVPEEIQNHHLLHAILEYMSKHALHPDEMRCNLGVGDDHKSDTETFMRSRVLEFIPMQEITHGDFTFKYIQNDQNSDEKSPEKRITSITISSKKSSQEIEKFIDKCYNTYIDNHYLHVDNMQYYYKQIPSKDGVRFKKYPINNKTSFDKLYFPEKAKIIELSDKLINGELNKLSLMLHGKPGCGKCLHPDTPVMMYDGTVRAAKHVQIGDMLMGDDSQPRKVLSLTSGVDIMYKINQLNGDSYIVNSPHILTLKKSGAITTGPAIIDIPLNEYLDKNKTWKSAYKGYKVAVDFQHQHIELDPYILGMWLGDSNWGVPEKEINHFTDCLRRYNLLNNKHIPHQYKCNIREVRLQVLAGLIDTNGYYNRECDQYEFTQKNHQLMIDVAFLCRTLGYKVSIQECVWDSTSIDKRTSNIYYLVTVNGPLDNIPVRLTRKETHSHVNGDILTCDIIVQELGPGNYCGWELDGNGRFLLGDCTVTHNTSIIKALAKYLKYSIIEVKLSFMTNDSSLMDIFHNKAIMYHQHNDDNFPLQTDLVPLDKRVYIFEDVDAECNVIHQRKNEPEPVIKFPEEPSDDKSNDYIHKIAMEKWLNRGLTLSGILNVLDGVLEINGAVIVMTTNHPDKLDEAFKRPGRITLSIEMKKMLANEANKMVKAKYGVELDNIRDFVFTPALFESYLQTATDLNELRTFIDSYQRD